MGRILGLDLGTNSIGWAIVDAKINKEGHVEKYHQIIDSGVRIFPEGLDPDTIGQGENEKSKNAQRREFRQKRRQFYRKRIRKIKLLELLIDYKMCPLTIDELNKWKYWDKDNPNSRRQFPDSELFNTWLRLNPYQLRSKALKKNISLEEFGRILYHFIQRRGFVSNRKEKDTGVLFKGKDDKVGISETKELMNEKLLGEYLYTVIPQKGESYKEYRDEKGRIIRARNRYTIREMYIEEFYHIWQKQAKHLGLDRKNIIQKRIRLLKGSLDSKRNSVKINNLYKKYGRENVTINGNTVISFNEIPFLQYIAGEIWQEDDKILYRRTNESVLFWQRPLRSQKNLLGKCRYEHQKTIVNGKMIETGKSPCYLSHPEFELFRAYQFINNIEYGTKQKLNDQQRETVLDLINSKKSNFKFEEIKKKLGLYERFNYDDEYSVPCSKTIANVKPLFDHSIWEKHYHDIWHCFHFYTDNEKLFNKLKNDYQCNCASVDKISKIILAEGYGSLSLKAIRNITPFLKKGYSLSLSVILGGVKNVFGKEKWELFANEHEKIENNIKHLMKQKNAEGELIEKIKDFLSTGLKEIDFGFKTNDKRFNKLYHPSVDLKNDNDGLKKELPPVQNLRNPLVQRALTETRHVVNALFSQYDKPDIIKIEMGRDLKNTPKTRREMRFTISDNQKKNDMAREKLSEFGLAHTRQNIRKYLLFKEIEENSAPVICPYTGKTIRINDLLGTGNLFQIEHIVPYSISLDDSFGNITLCESNFNREKGEKTPYEFYQSNPDPDLWGGAKSWDDIEIRAFSLLPYNKAKRFTNRKSLEKENFISRQLNDTRYISREAMNLMKEICDNVQILPGKLTAELRHLWGLNNILQPVEDVDLEIGEIDADFDKRIAHWAVVKEDGSFVSIHKKRNTKPSVTKGYCLFPGIIDKNMFSSEYFNDIPVENIGKGKYWCKVNAVGEPSFYPYFNDKPVSSSRMIVLRGNVNKGKFINDRIGTILDADNKRDGKYWASFDVEKVSYVGTERPKTKRGQISLWGKVKDGYFISYHYTCPMEQEEGGTWVILDLNIDEVVFTKISKEKPQRQTNQLLLSGIIAGDGAWVSDENPDQSYATSLFAGKYWALYEVTLENCEFIPMINEKPKPSKGEKVIEGDIWIDEHDDRGEVRFDPKKNRDDQRHHAIDAMTIACTERSALQRLSTYHAQMRDRNNAIRSKRPEFDAPWEEFRTDVQRSAEKILVSYFKDNRVLDKGKKFVTKNGKKHLVAISAVRGQLHKETVFGKRSPPDGRTAFHVRKPITSLANKTQVDKVVDVNIRKMIEEYLRDNFGIDLNTKYKVPDKAFYCDGEYLIKLPNKNGEEVPVKKVRMREEIGNARKLKTTLNQYVNPRNNHHVMIYRDHQDELKESIVSFWDVAQRLKRNEPMYQLPEDGKEMVTTMEINDMFLIGVPKGLDTNNLSVMSKYLYRVQKLSSSYYTFRHHLASTLNNPEEEFRIVSFKAWEKYNPQKVKIELNGNLTYD